MIESSRRVKIFVRWPTETIPFSPHAGQVLSEYVSGTAAANPERKYVYGEYIDEPLVLVDATGMSEALYYYHQNSQYSVCALTDSSGDVAERYAYDPYGRHVVLAPNGTTVRASSDVGNPYRFTGREFDDESGLHYFRARYFRERFLSRDLLEYHDGTHLYRPYFVPMHTDPSGHRIVCFGASGFVGVYLAGSGTALICFDNCGNPSRLVFCAGIGGGGGGGAAGVGAVGTGCLPARGWGCQLVLQVSVGPISGGGAITGGGEIVGGGGIGGGAGGALTLEVCRVF